MKCESPVCDRDADTANLCKAHYMRKWNTGDARLSEPIAPPGHAGGGFASKGLDHWFAVHTPQRGDGCWLWQGSMWGKYGRLYKGRKVILAHRYSYEAHVGPIPSGMVVRHTCDTPRCVNPAHLILGTLADNNRDAVERGRTARGESNGKTTITEAQAIEIKADTRTLHEIAREYGVSHSTVWNIRKGITWKHLA